MDAVHNAAQVLVLFCGSRVHLHDPTLCEKTWWSAVARETENSAVLSTLFFNQSIIYLSNYYCNKGTYFSVAPQVHTNCTSTTIYSYVLL